jgi:hypothetical protein
MVDGAVTGAEHVKVATRIIRTLEREGLSNHMELVRYS